MSKDNDGTDSKENQDLLKRRVLPFTMVEDAIIEDTGLSIYAKMVYTVLCYYANNDKSECFPKIKTIAEKASCSDRKVPDAVKELVKHGYIMKEARKRADNPKVNTSNLYTILVQYNYIKKKKPGVVHEMHQGGARDAHKLDSLNKSTGEIQNPEAVGFEDDKESKSMSSSAKEELQSFTFPQDKKKEIKKEVSKVYSEDKNVDKFIHSLAPVSRINILDLEAGSTVTIAEMLKYALDYVRITGREIENVSGFVWEGLKNEWQPGDYYQWGLEKLQAGGYE
ncbi:hypothetical protein ES705_17158 [subsurface metagenome]